MKEAGSCSPGTLRVGLVLIGLCMVGYILVPPVRWHFMELVAGVTGPSSCPPCICDCSSQPVLSIAEVLHNFSFGDCAMHEPQANREAEKSFTETLIEELKLREAETMENRKRADMALLEAKKVASQYQKEADKCNSGIETCEEARERAEAALAEQTRLTALWESRARRRGWVEGIVRTQAGIQTS